MRPYPAVVPDGYLSRLDPRETERGIKLIKDFFEASLAEALNLRRVAAPLFVAAGSGINDDLNGTEQPVRFSARSLNGTAVEVVQSLAKWKRLALAELGLPPGEGLLTDMNAIRPDEELDALHSLYVDQWDWERAILPADRHLDFLKGVVRRIYQVLRRTEHHVQKHYPQIEPVLPEQIVFLHTEDLAARLPHLGPRDREEWAVARYGAVFLIGIGAPLDDGNPHDGRAPDYDDWITPNGNGRGLNGDILVCHPVLGRAVELSSMGIRVTPETLAVQLRLRDCLDRVELAYHRRLLAGELPCSIGGGIGQSRLCLLFLRKAHIGEVQASVWPEEVRQACRDRGVRLL